MKRKTYWLAVVVISCFLVFSAAGCGGPPPEAKDLKVGLLVPLSGPAAPWGVGFYNGMELAIDEINAQGGITVGGQPYLLKMIAEDSKFDADTSVAALNKLLFTDKVKFIVGPLGSSPNAACVEISKNYDVLHFNDSFMKEVIGPDYPNIFRIVTTHYERAKPTYEWIAEEKPEIKRLALLARDDADGRDKAQQSAEFAEALGMEVVYEDYYAYGTTDYYPFLTRMIADNPDILDTCASSAGDLGLIIKQARELGWDGVVFDTAAPDAATIRAVAGAEAAEGLIGVGGFMGEPWVTPMIEDWAEAYIAKYGGTYDDIKTSGTYTYDAMYFLKQAIEQTDSLDIPTLVQALETMELDTRYGPGHFGAAARYGIGHQIVHDTVIREFRDGKWHLVGWAEFPE